MNKHLNHNQSKPFPLRCFIFFVFLCFFPGICIACIRAATSAVLKGLPSSPTPN